MVFNMYKRIINLRKTPISCIAFIPSSICLAKHLWCISERDCLLWIIWCRSQSINCENWLKKCFEDEFSEMWRRGCFRTENLPPSSYTTLFYLQRGLNRTKLLSAVRRESKVWIRYNLNINHLKKPKYSSWTYSW